jgi:hypothetical protein
MPLGDELTVGGYHSPGGYRKQLYLNLDQEGYRVDLVGTKSSNPAVTLPDSYHEGHKGWTVQDMKINIEEFLDKAEPDVILVMIGAQDLVESKNTNDIEHSAKRWDALILKITKLRPHVHIITSSLPDRKVKNYNKKVRVFNRAIETAALAHNEAGRKVSFIDMNAKVKRKLLKGKEHPGKAGYKKMGNIWASNIKTVIGKKGDNNRPRLLKVNGSLDRNEVKITFTKPIDDDSASKENFIISKGLAILSVRIDDDKRSIILSTERQKPGSEYKVTVKGGVKDMMKNPNSLIKQSTRKFSVGWRFLVLSDFHLGKSESYFSFCLKEE